ncbi:MAG: SUMF1/EgtB/PvdO family nonheme iron enzyme [Magnetococcus sp. YQC-9]
MINYYRNALPVGHSLGEYQIEAILGAGGFGVTYLALDKNLGKQVAIKEYLPNDLAVREGTSVHPKTTADVDTFRWGMDRFLQEARILARFHHPSIVQVLRYFESNNTAYMVMVYEDGDSLDNLLQKRTTPLDEDALKSIVLPLLDGLQVIHASNLIHRDIKPGNIYIRRQDETPVLLDFGSARQSVGGKSRSLSVVVSDGYAPAEQYETHGNQGPWTDLYALGAVIYRALSGEIPPQATARMNAIARKQPDPLIPAREVGRGRYSDEFLTAVDHALVRIEEDRPQSAQAWAAELSIEKKQVNSSPGIRCERCGSGYPSGARYCQTCGNQVEKIAIWNPVVASIWGLLFFPLFGTYILMQNWRALDAPEKAAQLKRRLYIDIFLYIVFIVFPGNPSEPATSMGKISIFFFIVWYFYWYYYFGSQQIKHVKQKFSADSGVKYIKKSWLKPVFAALLIFMLGGGLLLLASEAIIEVFTSKSSSEVDPASITSPKVESASNTSPKVESASNTSPKVDKNSFKNNKSGMEFVRVPLGCFQMGMSPDEKRSMEHGKDWGLFENVSVQHLECVAPMWVGKNEVTVGQFRQFVNETGYRTDAEKGTDGAGESAQGCFSHQLTGEKRGFGWVAGKSWRDPGYGQKENYPVVCVSWNDVQAYVTWLNGLEKESCYRLLTEVEWEYAARGGTTTPRFWGENDKQACQYANVADETEDGQGYTWINRFPCKDGYHFSSPVGHYRPNPFGLYDMLGNVMEWTCSAGDTIESGGEHYAKCSEKDFNHVHRGGSWFSNPDFVRSSFRLNDVTSFRSNFLGFRLARRCP